MTSLFPNPPLQLGCSVQTFHSHAAHLQAAHFCPLRGESLFFSAVLPRVSQRTSQPASQSTRRSFLVPSTAGPRTRWVPWQGPRLSFQGARSPLPLALDFFSASSSPFSTGLLVSSSSFLSFPTLLGTSQKHGRFLPSNLWLRLCIYQCRRRYRLIDRREALLPERLWLQQRLGLGSTLLLQLYSFNCVCNDAFDSLRLDESRLGALTSGSCPLHHATCSVFAHNTGPIERGPTVATEPKSAQTLK